jgi:phenylacetate-CoA ligase
MLGEVRSTRTPSFLDAFESFAEDEPTDLDVLGLFRRTASTVPAYGRFLAAHGVDAASVTTAADFLRLPTVDKESYLQRHPLPDLCRNGRIEECDIVSVSSGSSGRPSMWPRSVTDELHVARRFEQVLRDGFRAERRTTLAVVCFPLGTWVGGLFTTACVRHLAAKGYPITTVAPGNNPVEILRVLPELAPHFDQVVLLGYPPFLKGVIDAGLAQGVPWSRYSIKLVLAGEVFSEEWRTLVADRAGIDDPIHDVASLYGTADAGVLGNETPLSVAVRRFLARRPALARDVFGDPRLPTLVQYDPASRLFEVDDGRLLFTADGGVPLIRYRIGDEGGLIAHDALLDVCRSQGFDPVAASGTTGANLPFVFVFGRSLFTVSYYGANIYPENVTVGLEQPGISEQVTGKFVLEAFEDENHDRRLRVTVERAPDRADADPTELAHSICEHLLRLNSEFANYVPAEHQLPDVVLRPFQDPDYFPAGVKHRYTRKQSD